MGNRENLPQHHNLSLTKKRKTTNLQFQPEITFTEKNLRRRSKGYILKSQYKASIVLESGYWVLLRNKYDKLPDYQKKQFSIVLDGYRVQEHDVLLLKYQKQDKV